jgi:catechol 2,3-dioxygenase-like lactoylglutathione lyase family enzyme
MGPMPTSPQRHQRPRPVLAGLVLALCLIVPAQAPAQVARSVDSVAITVSDMDRALDFYTNVLPFQVETDAEIAGDGYARLLGVFGTRARLVRLRLGEEHIELVDFLAPEGRPIPVDSRSNDHWFQHVAIIVSDMDKAYALLRQHHVSHASTGPQVLPDWNPNAGGIAAFYFRDPDGNNLEILDFPPGKGKPRWQSTESLFLGIDHTAMVVGDTEASLRLWRDALGFEVVGESENYGPEQEHLNNVFGARLRITALKAPDGGIGVEFLEYLAPSTGRPTPVDTQANDLWHWHVNVATGDAEEAAAAARQGGAHWTSPGTIGGLDASLGYEAAALVRDPDGHGIILGQR